MYTDTNVNATMEIKSKTNLDDKEWESLRHIITDYLSSEKSAAIHANFPRLFDNILLIFKDKAHKGFESRILSKSGLRVDRIGEFVNEYSTMHTAIAVSFFLLYDEPIFKVDYYTGRLVPELFMGNVIYDLKNDEFMVFHLISLNSIPLRSKQVREDSSARVLDPLSFLEVAERLLMSIFVFRPHLASLVPLPTSYHCGMPIPFIYYSAINKKLDYLISQAQMDGTYKLNLRWFFAFGQIFDPLQGLQSFDYNKDRQSAFVQMYFNGIASKVLYQLRFDYKSKEKHMHLDFEIFHCDQTSGKRTAIGKIISHEAIDIWEISKLESMLMVLVLANIINDENFDEIFDEYVKGSPEISKHPILKNFLDLRHRKRIRKDDLGAHV